MTVIKIGFDIQVQDDSMMLTPEELANQIASMLPKEWWYNSREAEWGVAIVYPLDSDGNFRPMSGEKAARLVMEENDPDHGEYPHAESKWTHIICIADWNAKHPGRQVPADYGADNEPVPCCWCGQPTGAGIYLRADPLDVHGT